MERVYLKEIIDGLENGSIPFLIQNCSSLHTKNPIDSSFFFSSLSYKIENQRLTDEFDLLSQ